MDPEYPVEHLYIDTPAALSAAAKLLETAPRIVADLEADSMYHYKEKVCLIQIGTAEIAFVIDPLAVTDLSPLAPLFENPAIQKIFHGADYDVRSLYRDFGIAVHNLFDTELASRFLGVESTGLEAVVQAHCGITLDKKFQKKDWSRRPLPPEMIDYAARDVLYLLPIAKRLEALLSEKGRLSWVREECLHLSRVRPPLEDTSPAFMKVKGAGRLSPRGLAALEKILEFRDHAAQKKDKPLFKVFSNRAALALATERPHSLTALKECDVFSSVQMNMFAKPLLTCIKEADQLPEAQLPVYPRTRPAAPSAAAATRAKAIQEWRNQKAAVLEMDPGLICNRALAAQLAAQLPRTRKELNAVQDMKEWQKTAFGDEILSVLQSLSANDTASPKKRKRAWRRK